MKNKNDQIFVRVMKNGYIQQLGICGPIPNPIKVSRALAHRMVVGGVEVHEVDPVTKMTKKLTIHNVFSDEKTPVKEVPTQEAPVSKNEKPVETMTFVGTPVSEPEESETAVDKEVTEEDAEVSETEDAEKTDEITTHTSVKGKKKRK